MILSTCGLPKEIHIFQGVAIYNDGAYPSPPGGFGQVDGDQNYRSGQWQLKLSHTEV